jgi:spermidine synthase
MLRARGTTLAMYTLSGAAGLMYEVAWTRLLTLELGHTVAAASTVLAAFMGGLAIGAWAAGHARSRSRQSLLRTYAVLEIMIAVAALLVPIVLRASIPLLAWAYADGEAATRFAVIRIALSFLLIGLPSAAMGATFPIIASAVARSVRDAGILYAANTAGAATGAIAAGFWLIPSFGLNATTWTGVALNLAAAAGATWIAGRGIDGVDSGKEDTSQLRGRRSDTGEYSPALAA